MFTRVRESEAWPLDAFIVFPYKIVAIMIALGIVVFLIEQVTKWMRISADPRKSGKISKLNRQRWILIRKTAKMERNEQI